MVGLVSLIIQIALVLAVLAAAYLSRRKHDFKRHCLVMRIVVPLQIVAVALIMWSSMTAYLRGAPLGVLFNAELIVHHVFGLVMLALWIYINLVFLGIVRLRGKLKVLMRTAFISWVLAFFIGLHIYFVLWV